MTLESRRRAQRDSNPARPGIHSGPEPGPLFRTHVGFGSVADFRRVQVGVHPTPKTDITTGPALVRLGSKPEVAVPIQSRRSTRSGNHGGSSVQAPSPPSSALPAGVPRGQRRVFCEPWPARRRPRRLRKSRDHFIRRSDRSAGMCERVVSYLPLPTLLSTDPRRCCISVTSTIVGRGILVRGLRAAPMFGVYLSDRRDHLLVVE